MATLNLKIITPERVVYDSSVDQVTAVANDGELTILPGHEPLVTTLAIDVLRFKVKGEEETAAIIGGIMNVNNGEVEILSDMAELDVEIDEARASQAKARLEAEKTQKTDKVDSVLTEMALSRAMVRLKAAEMAKIRKMGRR
ncbi:MAG: ATP synthase F1 subunit epsilon [Candidatus Obscuribacterales bacterium]|jgi:F-type H+-transporting ATPase subunit epsilon